MNKSVRVCCWESTVSEGAVRHHVEILLFAEEDPSDRAFKAQRERIYHVKKRTYLSRLSRCLGSILLPFCFKCVRRACLCVLRPCRTSVRRAAGGIFERRIGRTVSNVPIFVRRERTTRGRDLEGYFCVLKEKKARE